MKIIDKHRRDFYDCIQGYGFDDDIVYVRTYEKIKIDCNLTAGYLFDKIFRRDIILGFAGQIYQILGLSTDEDVIKYCYNIDDIDKFVSNNSKKYEEWINGKKEGWASKFGFYKNPRNKILRELEEFDGKEYKKFFDNGPIFTIRKYAYYTESYLEVNPIIRGLEFVRIMNPQQAFQTLQMYLANQARPIKPIPKIDDKTMCEAKGFSSKFSFRKDKSKQK